MISSWTWALTIGLAIGWAVPNEKPNIVIIVADDLGYADLGCQDCKDIPTPNIDSIARQGMRFTAGYVSCPVCSPTRAGLLTGRYQQRFGHEFNPGPPQAADPSFGLPLSETTIANRLKALGYATGAFGKWHLGYTPEKHPLKRGFDEFYGFLGGAHSYLDPTTKKADPISRGTTPVTDRTCTTEAFAREAVGFIEKHKNEPFFVYLPFNAVHVPMEATDKYLSRFSNIANPRRRTFAAMLSAMDDGVGEVLAKLRALKLEERTLIVFHSDNGGPTQGNTSRNFPLSGFKTEVAEGGIRIPCLMQWLGHIPAGKVYEQPVIQLDICPTALAAAGAPPGPGAKFDGVNLLPFIAGENSLPPHDRLFWRFGARWAIRMGDWKLRCDGAGTAPKLFHLATDISEMIDLATKEKERAGDLESAWKAWNSQLESPRWAPQRPGKAKAKNKGKAKGKTDDE